MNAPPLLPELLEANATGRIAEIYAEIRLFSGVSYVSSLQRYLATIPGTLEWAWEALRPAIASGTIPQAGWRLAANPAAVDNQIHVQFVGSGSGWEQAPMVPPDAVRLTPAAPVSVATVRAWGVDRQALTGIRNIAANFVRVAPVNQVMGACLAALLNGARTGGTGFSETWTPPEPLPPMPGNVDLQALPPDQRVMLLSLGTRVDGTPFVPALYRQIAHWPSVLAWLAAELSPRFAAPETAAARRSFQLAARQAALTIVAQLPPLRRASRLNTEATRQVLIAIDRYAETSPEMTMFGQLILEALPRPEDL